jgi:2-oxoisovalerate dehydrogenase E1 component
MFGGDHGVPLVLRSKCAMGAGYGSQHSWIRPVSMPASGLAYRGSVECLDYVGLMNAAWRWRTPSW